MRLSGVSTIILMIVIGTFRWDCLAANDPNVLPTVNGIPVVRWEHLRNPYRTYKYGFSRGMTLATLLPDVQNPEPFYAQLWIENNGDLTQFWQKLLEAKRNGAIQAEMDALVASYGLYACEKAVGSLTFCPSPCRRADICGEHRCLKLRIGLYAFDYKCVCTIGYSWDPDSRRCQYCGNNSTWSLVWRTCVPIETQDGQDSGPTTVFIDPSILDWAAWGSWGECSNACGKGTSTRTRRCPLENDHDKCYGSRTEEEACSGFSVQCLADVIAYIGTAVTVIFIIAGIAFCFYYQKENDTSRAQGGTMFDQVMPETARERHAREYKEAKRQQLKKLAPSSRKLTPPGRGSLRQSAAIVAAAAQKTSETSAELARKAARASDASKSKKVRLSQDERIKPKRSQKTKSQPPLMYQSDTSTSTYSSSGSDNYTSSVLNYDADSYKERQSRRISQQKHNRPYYHRRHSYRPKYNKHRDRRHIKRHSEPSAGSYDNGAFEYNFSNEDPNSIYDYTRSGSGSSNERAPSLFQQYHHWAEPRPVMSSRQYTHSDGSKRKREKTFDDNHERLAISKEKPKTRYGSLYETDTTL